MSKLINLRQYLALQEDKAAPILIRKDKTVMINDGSIFKDSSSTSATRTELTLVDEADLIERVVSSIDKAKNALMKKGLSIKLTDHPVKKVKIIAYKVIKNSEDTKGLSKIEIVFNASGTSVENGKALKTNFLGLTFNTNFQYNGKGKMTLVASNSKLSITGVIDNSDNSDNGPEFKRVGMSVKAAAVDNGIFVVEPTNISTEEFDNRINNLRDAKAKDEPSMYYGIAWNSGAYSRDETYFGTIALPDRKVLNARLKRFADHIGASHFNEYLKGGTKIFNSYDKLVDYATKKNWKVKPEQDIIDDSY